MRSIWFTIWLLATGPALWIAADLGWNALGAEPIKEITHRTGDWALRFLLLTLAITPLRLVLPARWIIPYRRMLGLFAFFYATLHLLTYFALDQFFDFPEIWADILKRPYITIGWTAWVLLLPLAITSTRGWMRRLGKRWSTLHKAIYAAAILGVVHFWWLVKADIREPAIYASILGFLLSVRLWRYLVTNRQSASKVAQ